MNEEARKAIFTFLRVLDLNPMEWTQAVVSTDKGSPYIGEILDNLFSSAQAAVVLMTPDDEAYLRREFWKETDGRYEKELTPQARPNVIFEAGMAMGRYPDRTILVKIGKLRPFTDILGRYVVELNNKPETRHLLVQFLETIGCQVNRKGTDWLSPGNFDSVVEDKEISSAKPIAIQSMRRTEMIAYWILAQASEPYRDEFVSAQTLLTITNLSVEEINDTIRLLHDRTWIVWVRNPYWKPRFLEFEAVKITPYGREELEKTKAYTRS